MVGPILYSIHLYEKYSIMRKKAKGVTALTIVKTEHEDGTISYNQPGWVRKKARRISKSAAMHQANLEEANKPKTVLKAVKKESDEDLHGEK